MRYILALIPSKQHFLAYVQVAQNAFAPITDGYLLNEQNSLPHITICAFRCAEEELAPLWNDLQNLKASPCPIKILGLQLKKGHVPPHHYSVGLSVSRDAPLLHLHEQVVKRLHSREIACLNPCMDLYQPHLTLAGISWTPNVSLVLPSLIDELIAMPLPSLHLALVKGDDIGQCLEILYE